MCRAAAAWRMLRAARALGAAAEAAEGAAAAEAGVRDAAAEGARESLRRGEAAAAVLQARVRAAAAARGRGAARAEVASHRAALAVTGDALLVLLHEDWSRGGPEAADVTVVPLARIAGVAGGHAAAAGGAELVVEARGGVEGPAAELARVPRAGMHAGELERFLAALAAAIGDAGAGAGAGAAPGAAPQAGAAGATPDPAGEPIGPETGLAADEAWSAGGAARRLQSSGGAEAAVAVAGLEALLEELAAEGNATAGAGAGGFERGGGAFPRPARRSAPHASARTPPALFCVKPLRYPRKRRLFSRTQGRPRAARRLSARAGRGAGAGVDASLGGGGVVASVTGLGYNPLLPTVAPTYVPTGGGVRDRPGVCPATLSDAGSLLLR